MLPFLLGAVLGGCLGFLCAAILIANSDFE